MKQQPLQRIPQLDGIRGLAILLVILCHYGNNQLAGNDSQFAYYFKLATSYAWSGVDLFFILSGFLLGGILMSNKNSPHYFKTFYIRRFFRIFPIYYLSLFALLLIIINGYAQAPGQADSSIPSWSYFVFLQNIFMGIRESLGNKWLTHTWSLALEEQFYLVLPFLIYFLRKRTLLIVLGLCIIAAPAFRYFNYDNWYQSFSFLYCRFDSLFAGVVVMYIVKTEKLSEKAKKLKPFLYSLFFALIIGTGLISFQRLSIPYIIENTWMSLLYCLLILLVSIDAEGWLGKTFSYKWLIKLGIISYGLYLFHQPISLLMHYYIFRNTPQINTFSELIITFSSLIISIILAVISYHYFEKRMIAYGHRYKY